MKSATSRSRREITLEGENSVVPERRLAPAPVEDLTNWSVRRISTVAAAFPNMNSYLEIGLDEGLTFEKIPITERVGVDPRPRFDWHHLPPQVSVHRTSSDDYFAQLEPDDYFDVIFLDGLHTYEQTYRDLINALDHCPWGMVLIDDVIPCDEVSAMRDLHESFAERLRRGWEGLPWHGDVFRLLLCVADHHPELEYVTIVDIDNPQTLVWKKRFDGPSRSVDEATLSTYMNHSFDDVFAKGVPSLFNPMSESDALDRAITALRALREQRRPPVRRVMARLVRDITRLGQFFNRSAEH